MMRFTLAGLALALSAGSALAQNPVQQFNMIGVDYLATISRSADGTRAPCQPTEGHRPADGTQSWEPDCFGVFITPGQDTRIGLTRGTGNDANGNPLFTIAAPLVVQAQSDGNRQLEQNGMLINMDIVGGSVSAAGLDTTNTTGQLISLRQRPSASGQRPPSTWGHNIDLHIAPGAGNVLSFGVEYDQNNFNKDCGPGSGCLSTSMFFNGISGAPNTSYLFAGTPTTGGRVTTATVSGNVITRTGRDEFQSFTSLVTINGTRYRVRYLNANQVAAEGQGIPDSGPVDISWNNAGSHYGVLWVGDNNIQDAGFNDGSTSRVAFQASNAHLIGLDTSQGDMPYAVSAKSGQRVCLDGYDSCLLRNGGQFELQAGGYPVLQVVNNADPRSGLKITAQSANGGTILEPIDNGLPNVPLHLRARGSETVQMHTAAIAHQGLSIRGGAGLDFRDMQGFAETIRMRDGQIVTWDQSRIFQFGGWLYFGSANGASNWMRINTATGQVETKLPVVQNAGM